MISNRARGEKSWESQGMERNVGPMSTTAHTHTQQAEKGEKATPMVPTDPLSNAPAPTSSVNTTQKRAINPAAPAPAATRSPRTREKRAPPLPPPPPRPHSKTKGGNSKQARLNQTNKKDHGEGKTEPQSEQNNQELPNGRKRTTQPTPANPNNCQDLGGNRPNSHRPHRQESAHHRKSQAPSCPLPRGRPKPKVLLLGSRQTVDKLG